VLVDQRQGPVLHLACQDALAVNQCYFLALWGSSSRSDAG
jgi:hypothetical protein